MKAEAHGCPREDAVLFVNGKLKDRERSEFEEHLKGCKECQDYLEFVQRLTKAMKDLPEPKREPCPSSLILSLYSSGNLEPKVAAHVSAHILYCDECFKEVLQLEKMEETLAEKIGEPSAVKPVYKLVIRFLKDLVEILEATGKIFQGRELALARVRGPRREYQRNFVTMTQDIGDGISAELKVARTEIGRNAISIFAYYATPEEKRKGIADLSVTLRPKDGEVSIARVTPPSGIVELGEWNDGDFVLEVSDAKGKTANIHLDLHEQEV
jgi:hypothetical protein